MQPEAVNETRVVRARIGVFERIARLWRYRELLVGLVRKELKVKYKNSTLGFAWSLLNPLLYLIVFYVAFQLILNAGIPQFPIYLLSGLLVWNLYSVGVSGATAAITGNSDIVKKVSFPREILPLAAVGAALVHFFLQFVVLVAALIVVRHDIALSYLPLLPLALVAVLVFAGGLGLLLAATNVYVRDTQHFLELALLAWFWMTPIVYPFMQVDTRGAEHQWLVKLYLLNPFVIIVMTFQRALYAQLDATQSDGTVLHILPHWGITTYLLGVLAVLAVAIVLFIVGMAVFARAEGNFAEEL